MLMPFTGTISILTSHSWTAFLNNVIEVLCFGRFLTCVQHSIMMCYSSGMGRSSSIGVKAVIFRRVENNLEVSATVFQWISGPAGICSVLSVSDIWIKYYKLVIICFYKQQFTLSWQERGLAQSHLSFFLMPSRKACKEWCGAAVSLAEELLCLWVWKEKPQEEREGVTLSESSLLYFLWQQSLENLFQYLSHFMLWFCLLFIYAVSA